MENNLQAQIAAYFAAIDAQLQELPAARRAEFADEIRAHLHAMVEAKRADGLDEARAWPSAMREFGEPDEVGRGLYKQWAKSGQLESEGAPLSARDIIGKFGWRFVWGVMCAAAFSIFGSPATWHGPWVVPAFALFLTLAIGRGIYLRQREFGKWTPSAITGMIFAVVVNAFVLGTLQWGDDWAASVLARGGGIAAMLCLGLAALSLWLYRREAAQRPWQFTSRFKSSPIAAEQEYRISPVAGAAMGGVFGLLLGLPVTPQFLGLPVIWLVCAGLICAVALCAWRLRK